MLKLLHFKNISVGLCVLPHDNSHIVPDHMSRKQAYLSCVRIHAIVTGVTAGPVIENGRFCMINLWILSIPQNLRLIGFSCDHVEKISYGE